MHHGGGRGAAQSGENDLGKGADGMERHASGEVIAPDQSGTKLLEVVIADQGRGVASAAVRLGPGVDDVGSWRLPDERRVIAAEYEKTVAPTRKGIDRNVFFVRGSVR